MTAPTDSNGAGGARKWEKSDFPIAEIKPTWQNELIYAPFAPDNDDDWQLIQSIRAHGIQEPLVLSSDGRLLSGHRRLAAARYLGLERVPVRFDSIVFDDLPSEQKLEVLQRFNQQRAKTFEELVREKLLHIDTKAAHRKLLQQQIERIKGPSLPRNVDLGVSKRRPKITTTLFGGAALKVVRENEPYWPLTVRRIHYLLLNDPPLRHDRKPGRYGNTAADYKALTNLVTRLRLTGYIPMQAIEDGTRPTLGLQGFDSADEFVEQEARNFLTGYSRNLLQGQSVHVEVILEKSALRTIVEEVAREFCVPVTTTRGYCSLPPRYDIWSRFRRSGKKQLVLLFLTDFDPDGEQIAASFASSMRDDFGVNSMVCTKVLLTSEDIKKYELPSDVDAKSSSPQYAKFVRKHGHQAVELDAAPVWLIQEQLRDAIKATLDLELLNQQREQEALDAADIEAIRTAILDFMKRGT